MKSRKRLALTIAGSDSGGGAGIQADLKTFAALGVHGLTAITCLTAQTPKHVYQVETASPAILEAQLQALFDDLPPQAVKTGMLFSSELIKVVVRCWTQTSGIPLVVDPVMVATSRAALLKSSALSDLKTELLPLASLITPNLDEAEALSGCPPIRSIQAMREIARELHGAFGAPILLKGGHLQGGKEAVDLLYDGDSEWLLRAPYVRRISTHGTGCTYSAAITAFLARGASLFQSVSRAKEFITGAIVESYRIGRFTALDPLWKVKAARF